MTLRPLNYGNYGVFLIMGNAGFCPSTEVFGMLCHLRLVMPTQPPSRQRGLESDVRQGGFLGLRYLEDGTQR